MFETITNAHWARALPMARAFTNSVSAQIKMKLHPYNRTPGYEPKPTPHMIKFEPLVSTKGIPPNTKTSQFFACKVDDKTLGYLHPQDDGLYNFYPNHLVGMNWGSSILKEIAFKMDALNLPQAIEAVD
jgi:hypothetical protein